MPSCGAYIDVPLAVLLRAWGVHLLGCVGAGACWEQHAWGRPGSRVVSPRPTPPASFKHSIMQSFIHSSIPSLIHAFMHSLIHAIIQMRPMRPQTSHTVMRCSSCVRLAYHCRKVAKPSRPTLLGEEPAAPKLRLQLSRTRSCSAWMSLSRGLVSCRIASVPGPGGDAPASTPPHAGPCTTIVTMAFWQTCRWSFLSVMNSGAGLKPSGHTLMQLMLCITHTFQGGTAVL